MLIGFCCDKIVCSINRDQYVLYQRKRVEEVDDERLKFEISTILSREVILFYFIFVFNFNFFVC